MAWRRVRFRDADVLARCDDSGALAAEDGRVEIRYRPQDSRAYRAALRNLVPSDNAILPDTTCVPAAEAGPSERPTRSGRSKSTGGMPSAAPEGAIVVYADGACSGNPGPCGAGIVLIDGRARRELSQYLGEGTNNIAELTAIQLAAESIADADVGKPVRMYTDSQYAIGVLTKGWKAKANVELIAKLRQQLKRFSDLQMIYVRGHSGVVLNERADVLAVEAVQQRESSGWVKVSE